MPDRSELTDIDERTCIREITTRKLNVLHIQHNNVAWYGYDENVMLQLLFENNVICSQIKVYYLLAPCPSPRALVNGVESLTQRLIVQEF